MLRVSDRFDVLRCEVGVRCSECDGVDEQDGAQYVCMIADLSNRIAVAVRVPEHRQLTARTQQFRGTPVTDIGVDPVPRMTRTHEIERSTGLPFLERADYDVDAVRTGDLGHSLVEVDTDHCPTGIAQQPGYLARPTADIDSVPDAAGAKPCNKFARGRTAGWRHTPVPPRRSCRHAADPGTPD